MIEKLTGEKKDYKDKMNEWMSAFATLKDESESKELAL